MKCDRGGRYLGALNVCIVGILQIACSVSYPNGLLVDEVHFDKEVFAKASNMNLVSDLRQRDFDRDGTDDILAVASDGIHLLGMDGREKRLTRFQASEPPFAVKMVDGAANGRPLFLGNLPMAGKTVVFDDAGAIMWSASGSSFDDPVAADLEGDGRPEVIARNATGLAVLNLDGTLVRQLPGAGNPLFYGAADMDGDGKSEILTEVNNNGKNEISIFSGAGDSLGHWTSPHAFYRFGVARASGVDHPTVMALNDDAEDLLFLDRAGKLVQSLAAPWGNHLATPRGEAMPVGKTAGFVCLATSRGSNHHHVVYVYKGDQQLVYADSVPDDADALLVMNGASSQSFLVGSRNVIWKYTAKP
jgi:hypothetical protein